MLSEGISEISAAIRSWLNEERIAVLEDQFKTVFRFLQKYMDIYQIWSISLISSSGFIILLVEK